MMHSGKKNSFFSRSVPSSSLVEVITSFVIISMIFGFAIIIYLNVQRSAWSSHKLACYKRIEEVYADARRSKHYVSRDVDYGDIKVYQDVNNHDTIEDLIVIRLEARNPEGKLMAVRKYLVYASSE